MLRYQICMKGRQRYYKSNILTPMSVIGYEIGCKAFLITSVFHSFYYSIQTFIYLSIQKHNRLRCGIKGQFSA